MLRALDEASAWSQKTHVLISAFLLSSLMSLGRDLTSPCQFPHLEDGHEALGGRRQGRRQRTIVSGPSLTHRAPPARR